MPSALIFTLDQDIFRAHLFDTVEGSFRFLASSEVAGWAQCRSGVPDLALAAATDIESITGRTLFSRGRPLSPATSDGNGVDSIGSICVPRGRLRVAVVGADRELAYDSGPRAVEGAGHEVCHILCVDKRDLKSADVLYDATRLLLKSEPDIILVTAAETGRGDDELGTIGASLSASFSVPGPASPTVLFAGSDRQEASFRQSLGVGATFERVRGLRPAPDEESLEEVKYALCRLQIGYWSAAVPEYRRFTSWLGLPPVHRDVALGRSIRFLAATHNVPVHAVDLNRFGVGFFRATPSTYSSFRDPYEVRWDHLEDWLSARDYSSNAEIAFGNLVGRPVTVASTAGERAYEGSLLRHLCRSTLEDQRNPIPEITESGGASTILATGDGCSAASSPAEAALLLLDALQPIGTGQLMWDGEGLLGPAGVLCESQPRLAAELLLGDFGTRLGWFVAPTGSFRSGVRAIEAEATLPDRTALRVEVQGGELETLPVPSGGRTVVEVRSSNSLDASGHLGHKSRLEVDSACLGVVFDARGRPLVLPEEETALTGMASRWLAGLDAESTTEVLS